MKINIILSVVVVFISACVQTYPKTGNSGIDLALANQSLSHETKMNILRRHYGQAPVYQTTASQNQSAQSYRPVVDPAKCKRCDYERDLSQCHQIMEENTNLTGNAAAGAAGGALTGALIGAMLDVDPGHVAAMGATAGGLQGVGQELQTRNAMIARCMQGRGYSVLK